MDTRIAFRVNPASVPGERRRGAIKKEPMMLTFHRNPNDTGGNNTIAVFRVLNRLGGLDPTDPLWDNAQSGVG